MSTRDRPSRATPDDGRTDRVDGGERALPHRGEAARPFSLLDKWQDDSRHLSRPVHTPPTTQEKP